MKIYSSLFLLGALGVLGAHAAGVDTSAWKCESCPFDEAGTHGSVDVGVRAVSDDSRRFGNFTGLKNGGVTIGAAGDLRYRGSDGLYADAVAEDLTRDARSLRAEGGSEGRFGVKLAYDQIPRYLSETATTPFLGVGGGTLSLPAGYPAAGTGAMPLATTLQPVDIGYRRTRLDLGGAFTGVPGFDFRVDARRTARDGTQRMGGSFYGNAAQLAAPLDQTTNDLEATASYFSRSVQASLSYVASSFENGQAALSWKNPFTAVNGAGSGQLALAPDNQFHQVRGSLGWEIASQTRLSADWGVGRMTQDAGYLAATANASLGPIALPAPSLNAQADTLNAALRLSSTVWDTVRLQASFTRDQRDNKTGSLGYTQVSTDMFVGATRANPVYSFTQDKARASIDWRGPLGLKFTGGAVHDEIERTQQEVAKTSETSAFGRVAGRVGDMVSLELKGSHAVRRAGDYQKVAWIDPAQNPLMRKYNLADRKRDTFGVRADFAVAEGVSLGLDGGFAYDDYPNSQIGLTYGRSQSLGGDLSWAVNEETQLTAFGRAERMRSRQVGSQLAGSPDWSAINRDGAQVLGLGLRHAAMKGALNLGADLSVSRSASDTDMVLGASAASAFPQATTRLDSLKLFASYSISDAMTVMGSWWYERFDTQDWHVDGVQAATVSNLLSLGDTAPRYHVNVLRVALRYRF